MIQFEYSPDETLLYIALGDGPATDFLPFVARHGGRPTLLENIEEGGILARSP